MAPKGKRRRGYPVAVLIGFEENAAVVWQVFSRMVKPLTTVRLEGNRTDPKALYNFHEALVNALRPTLKEGVRSIVVASPPRAPYFQEFLAHVGKRHQWLMQGENKIAVSEITGSAATPSQVAQLANSPSFRGQISETTSEETSSLLGLLEKRLNTLDREGEVLFSLAEAEDLILYAPKTSTRRAEYLILTDKYLAGNRQKNRLHRLMQIAANKHVKTRVVDSESPAGQRIAQLGGFVCLAKKE